MTHGACQADNMKAEHLAAGERLITLAVLGWDVLHREVSTPLTQRDGRSPGGASRRLRAQTWKIKRSLSRVVEQRFDVVAFLQSTKFYASTISRAAPRTSISKSMSTTGGRQKCHARPFAAAPRATNSCSM